ncbi:hypothetical protein [Salinithrix halophila]|uniref:hypothetical protein n=1 Tax=Salinithrix halophila TaxID=1485204 RepID=UPI0036D40C3E
MSFEEKKDGDGEQATGVHFVNNLGRLKTGLLPVSCPCPSLPRIAVGGFGYKKY